MIESTIIFEIDNYEVYLEDLVKEILNVKNEVMYNLHRTPDRLYLDSETYKKLEICVIRNGAYNINPYDNMLILFGMKVISVPLNKKYIEAGFNDDNLNFKVSNYRRKVEENV